MSTLCSLQLTRLGDVDAAQQALLGTKMTSGTFTGLVNDIDPSRLVVWVPPSS